VTEKRAVMIAGTAHLVLVAALSLTWGLANRDLPAITESVPVDFVDIADLPKVTRLPEPSIAAAPRETVEAPDAPVPDQTKDVPPPDEISQKEALPPPDAKPKEQPKPAKKRPQELSNLVDKALAEAPRRTKPSDFAKSIAEAIPVNARIDARTAATLAQAIRERIYKCWDPNAGGADARTIKTLLRVDVARDGTVVGRPLLVRQTGVTGSNAAYAQVARDAAIRAVMNPACSLAGLPPELYEGWKSFELNFDASELL
jgi:hypothetical protein